MLLAKGKQLAYDHHKGKAEGACMSQRSVPRDLMEGGEGGGLVQPIIIS